MTWELPMTGGCYCGAIRYESTDPPVRSAMCDCRMCQRWSGAPAATGVLFDLSTFRFTKGRAKTYMTSPIMERSFCGDCGTQIMSRYTVPPYGPNRPHISVGTLDHPEETEAPSLHFGIESHHPQWLILEEGVTQRRAEDDPGVVEMFGSVSEEE